MSENTERDSYTISINGDLNTETASAFWKQLTVPSSLPERSSSPDGLSTYERIGPDLNTVTISVDGNYNAESMRILGNHLLALSKRLEQPSPTDDVHNWFELSYAQYLTVPRSVLQSMPSEWQRKFVALLEEMDETIDWRPKEGRYWVRLKDSKGRYVADPLMDYERGRRLVEHKGLQEKG